MVTHEEIVEFLIEEVEQLTLATKCRTQAHKHLDETDDDYIFVEVNLDRWGDRRVPA